MTYPLLSIENLTVDFGKAPGKTRAVDGITLTVNRGEIVAIVGESGSGKSVTSLSLLQLLSPKETSYPSGKLMFSADGKTPADLLALPAAELLKIRGAAISMIFQEPMTSLNPVLTCGEQVMEAIRVHKKCSRADAGNQTLKLFRQVRLPDPERILKAYPHEISGGQKQRVMIAMAISCNPALLIADEPTTALDVTVQKSILELLVRLQAETNMGMVFISHDLGIVQDIAHRVVVLYRGRIMEQNTTREIFSNPQHPYTRALLDCRPVLHAKGMRLPVISDFWQPDHDITALKPIISKEQPTSPEPRPTLMPTPLLRIEHLKMWYPLNRNIFGKPKAFVKAIDGVDFEVLTGETLGIVGESGCGKTTLGRAILRLVQATHGRIWHQGRDILTIPQKEMQSLRKEFQIVFQDPYASLNPRIPVGEAIGEAMRVHGIKSPGRSEKDQVINLLEKVNLDASHYHRYPHAFSGGQRQRIGIARALALDPGFIVFDESVSALDVSVQAQVLNLLNDLKTEYGFTALFISHDLGVVKYISDRVLVMKSGKIEEIGSTESVINSPKSPYTRSLLESIPGSKPVLF